ncbi:hypothetical protein CDL15_Pgr023179 [Punica granatum]|uniref:Uncharacterized protein n=1 Tax=Punica granatum TaxID=22663 RepID=A0A218X451_PUNGR|nr:hypothetical protein CDL15_Pgr023179 [Punica granatum]
MASTSSAPTVTPAHKALKRLSMLPQDQLQRLLILARGDNLESERLSRKGFVTIDSNVEWIIDYGVSRHIEF